MFFVWSQGIVVFFFNRIINHTLFDKRKTYPFEIFSFPHGNTCMARSAMSGVVYGQILRRALLNSAAMSFKNDCSDMFSKLIGERRWAQNTVIEGITRFYKKHTGRGNTHFGYPLPPNASLISLVRPLGNS